MECTCGPDSGVQWSRDIAFLSSFHHSPYFSSFYYLSSFYYFNSDFWYIDMHPTLAGLYPFLLGSPARCAFLSLFMFIYICLGSPARSQLSRCHSCPNSTPICQNLYPWSQVQVFWGRGVGWPQKPQGYP